MGLVADLWERRVHPSNPDAWYIRLFAGENVDAGVRVTEESALSSTAIYAGVRLLAEALATVPLNVYRRTSSVREVATEHPLHDVLHNQWNPWLTAAEGRSILLANAIVCGNGYAEVVRDGAGAIRELWPIWPNRMEPREKDGGLRYVFQPMEGAPREIAPDKILHTRGFSMGGLVGDHVVLKMREAVGLTLATEKFGASFFGKGANPGGVLEHPSTLSEQAQKRLVDSWQGGLDSAHRIKVLEEGLSFKPISVPPEAAQFLETRRFQIGEVARMLKIPPHMLGDLERATFSNIEHQAIEFVRYSLRPWAVLLEQRLNGLLTPAERAEGYYVKHVLEGLLRGDLAARSEAYAIGRQWGWYSANDIRELEDMNPIADGDIYLVPGNMLPANQAGAMMQDEPPADVEDDIPDERVERRAFEVRVLGQRETIRAAQLRTLEQVAGRVVAREVREVRARMETELRDAATFRAWLDEFYGTFDVFARDLFLPALLSFAQLMAASAGDELGGESLEGEVDEFVRDYADTLGVRWAAQSRREITRILRDSPDDAEAEIRDLLNRWESTKPATVANHEATRAGSAFLRAAYIAAGVTFVRWVARGDNCPLCSRMNGKIVEVQRSFLEPGDVVDPEDGETAPLEIKRKISHPPLHTGCDCGLIAEVQ